ncbi:hypothetical protein SAVCW2_14500 [Streptomyces avermitilis]|nr:hypothetical protein SAVCW2_14500 [Streptomyces avermitilis]
MRTADAHDLRKLPNVLTQRLPGAPATVEVELRLDSEEPGARAGLAVLGDAFSWIGLQRGRDGSVQLVHRFDESVAMGHPPHLRGSGGRSGTPRTRGSRPAGGPGCGSRSAGERAAASRTTPGTAVGPPARSSPPPPGAGSAP